jgi:hypothetical protein
MIVHRQTSLRVPGGSPSEVSAMDDRRKCRTYAASPAEPGGLPVMLAVGAIRSRRRLALVQKRLDKLEHDVRRLEFKESRRLLEAIHSRSHSESLTQQQDVSSIISPEETGAG